MKQIVLNGQFLLEFKFSNDKHNVGTYTNTTGRPLVKFYMRVYPKT